ncbi:protein kinase [Planctomycetota bacterium]|nr:protein kinase [Planctomycetota bacterium]
MVEAVGGDSPPRVMVVDDDGVALAVLARGLSRRGYRVITYRDPMVAMEHLSLDLPAAVITDMRMPGMTGLDVVTRVQEILGDDAPPVVVVSSEDDESMLEEAFRLGAADYLLKPVNEKELKAKLERALKPRVPKKKETRAPSFPSQVGKWKLLESIGRGGTACVFRALKLDGSDTTYYALKIVWPHLVDCTETLLRFRREIDTLGHLEHDRLVTFVESGRHDSYFYYVMSYLAGGSLRDRIRKQGARPAVDAMEMLAEAIKPLGYLHGQGLVHRDIKPGNLFYDEHDNLVVGDFGLAKQLADRGITLSEEFIGTPLYLAPEVLRSPEFDETVDFYALGVCALEMLLGEPPLQEVDSLRLIATIMEEGLPPTEQLVPGIDKSVAAVLGKMLDPDPQKRYRTAAELEAAVSAVLAHLKS